MALMVVKEIGTRDDGTHFIKIGDYDTKQFDYYYESKDKTELAKLAIEKELLYYEDVRIIVLFEQEQTRSYSRGGG